MKNYKKGFTLKAIAQSFKHSLHGFKVLLENEYNLYIQIMFAVVAIIFGFIFEISALEWAIKFTVIGLVIFSELVNTAIENIMDIVHPEYSERVRDIKDMASAAVLFMVLVSIIVGLLIYVPKIIILL